MYTEILIDSDGLTYFDNFWQSRGQGGEEQKAGRMKEGQHAARKAKGQHASWREEG